MSPVVARHLRGIVDRLDGVTDLRPGAPRPPWQPSRRNAHYETVLWFADIVLRHESVDLPEGSVEVNGFMIDMATVFEDFLTTAFTDAFALRGGRVVAQDKSRSLDEGGTIELKPDIVWYRVHDPMAVIDAKYKAEKPAGYPNADVYQMLAYCTALGLAEGHLVYAKGNEEPAVHRIRNCPVTVFAHALDLGLPPVQLLARSAASRRRSSSDSGAHTGSPKATWSVALPPFPRVRLVAPEEWKAFGWGLNRAPCAESGCTQTDTATAVLFWRVTEVFGEPCNWTDTLFDPGSSVSDLANALHQVPTRHASEPVPVSIDGAEGTYLEWSVPGDVDFSDCDEGFFESWKGDVGGTDRYQQLPGQIDRIWILDVGDDRLVIDAFYLPATPTAQRNEIDTIIESITFE